MLLSPPEKLRLTVGYFSAFGSWCVPGVRGCSLGSAHPFSVSELPSPPAVQTPSSLHGEEGAAAVTASSWDSGSQSCAAVLLPKVLRLKKDCG